LDTGLVEKTTSPWNHTIFVVRVTGKSPRIVINPFHLNRKLQPKDIRYPMPSIFDFRSKIGNSSFFSKIDLKSAFNQIQIRKDDRYKLAFSVKGRGQFRFARVPFGIASAPAMMQRVTDEIASDLEGLCCYMDDVLVYAESEEELEKRTTNLIEKLTKANLRINFEKSEFGVRSLRFLGFQIDKDQISLLPDTTEALESLPIPKTVRQLQAVLGAFNFTRMHIKGFADIATPLYNLLKTNQQEGNEHPKASKKEGDISHKWTTECDDAFRQLKKSVAEAYHLVHPNPASPKRLTTDASSKAVGACLEQWEQQDKKWKPIGFFSKKLTSSQQNYAAIQREALAIVLAAEHFKPWLLRDEFHLRSDHAPLKFVMEQKDKSALFSRWFLRLLPFRFSFEHIKGVDNHLADMLSRAFESANDSSDNDFGLDDSTEKLIFQVLLTLPSMQLPPPEIWNVLANRDICASKHFATKTKSFSDDHYLQVDTKAGPRIFVPTEYQNLVLQWAHDQASHLGVDKTKGLVQSRFTWDSLGDHIARYVKTCDHCQKTKGSPPNRQGFLKPILVTDLHERWGVDLLQLGDEKVLSMMEYFSKYPELYIVTDYSADTVIHCLEQTFLRYGFPRYITHDRGAAFLSEKVQLWLGKHGITSQASTPYHPSTDGLVERYNKTITQMLRATSGSFQSRLSKALAAYRNSIHESTGATPHQIMFNQYEPGPEIIRKKIGIAQLRQKAAYDKPRVPFDDIVPGDLILLYNSHKMVSKDRKTVHKWSGPFKTTSVQDNTLEYTNGERSHKVSRHLVRKYFDRMLDQHSVSVEEDTEKSKGGEKRTEVKTKEKKESRTIDHPERFDMPISPRLTPPPPPVSAPTASDPTVTPPVAPSNATSIVPITTPPISSSSSSSVVRSNRNTPLTLGKVLQDFATLNLMCADKELPRVINNIRDMIPAKSWSLRDHCKELLKNKDKQAMRTAIQNWAQDPEEPPTL